MAVTKYGINRKMIFGKRPFVYKPLKIGGLVLLMMSFASAAASTFRITLNTFSPYYSPKFVQIAAGTPISWENPTANIHSITHDGCISDEQCDFDSGPIGPNRTFTVNHLPPGYYPYHCSFHPIMRGTLVVIESASPSET
ncbi:MAG: cupredoxin domain-containing protein [Nitrospirota bacterium]|nr:cupredoxin domain-containing protein [Nitrospirota bacterium]